MTYANDLKAYAKRRREIRKLRAQRYTLQAIAEKYGITRQRVHQILNGSDR